MKSSIYSYRDKTLRVIYVKGVQGCHSKNNSIRKFKETSCWRLNKEFSLHYKNLDQCKIFVNMLPLPELDPRRQKRMGQNRTATMGLLAPGRSTAGLRNFGKKEKRYELPKHEHSVNLSIVSLFSTIQYELNHKRCRCG